MGHVDNSQIAPLYASTTPGAVADATPFDPAIAALIVAINENFDSFEAFKASVTLPIPDQSIVERHIRNLAVTNPKLANLAVTADKLADGSITLTKLADLVVTAAKIANGTITEPKYATGSVSSRAIGPGEVKASNLDPALLPQYGNIATNAKFELIDAQLAEPMQEGLARFARKMYNVESLTIDWWGDSLVYGALPGGAQSSSNPPSVLQSVLRSYYLNNLIVVNNHGTPGETLAQRLTTWESDIASSTAAIVIIDYGTNDANAYLTNSSKLLEFRNNVKTAIKTVIKYNKIPILATPDLIWALSNLNSAARYTLLDSVSQYANVIRKLAGEYNLPLLDSAKATEKYMFAGNIGSEKWDGIHYNNSGYRYKGIQAARLFMHESIPHMTVDDLVPLWTSGILLSGTYVGLSMPKSKILYGVFGEKLRIPIYVSENNVDVFIAFHIWQYGTEVGIIKFDDEVVKTNFKCYLPGLPNGVNAKYTVDTEMLIKKNVKAGFHYIEVLSNSSTAYVGGTYLRLRKNIEHKYNQIPSGTTVEDLEKVLNDITFTSSATAKYIITDIATSNLTSDQTAEVKAQFAKGNGMLINWSPVEGDPFGYGIFLFLDGTTGHLTGQGYDGNVINQTSLSSVDLSDAVHIYKLVITTAGLITVYVDEMLAGSFTVSNLMGGFLGFNSNATTQHIEYVKLAR